MTKYNKDKVWMFRQWRFDTTNHPVRTSDQPITITKKLNLSHNEKQALEGFARSCGCSTSEAVRIALHEWKRFTGGLREPLEAKTKRTHRVSVGLTASDERMLNKAAEALEMKVIDALRFIVLTLQRDLRDDKVKSLGGCKLISQSQLKREHLKANKPANPQIQKLREEYEQRGEELAQERYEEDQQWGQYLDHAAGTGQLSTFIENGELDFLSFKHWYTQAYLTDNESEAELADAFKDPDKDKAVKVIARQIMLLCDDLTWKEALEEAERQYEEDK